MEWNSSGNDQTPEKVFFYFLHKSHQFWGESQTPKSLYLVVTDRSFLSTILPSFSTEPWP